MTGRKNIPAKDRIGQVFGRLTIVDFERTNNRSYYICDCSCGTKSKKTRVDGITSGATLSCGCHSKDVNGMRRHGKYQDRIYKIWAGIKGRVLNVNDESYLRYGGAGIGISEDWLLFENFYRDMGEPPSTKHSIDRIDNSKGYSHENCRWASDSLQAKNQNKRSKGFCASKYKGVGRDNRTVDPNKGWFWCVTKEYKTVRKVSKRGELYAAMCFNYCTKALYNDRVVLNEVNDLELTIGDAEELHKLMVAKFGEYY